MAISFTRKVAFPVFTKNDVKTGERGRLSVGNLLLSTLPNDHLACETSCEIASHFADELLAHFIIIVGINLGGFKRDVKQKLVRRCSICIFTREHKIQKLRGKYTEKN
jgi:hypothetical protein